MDDAITPSNPPIALVEEKELEKTLFVVNVSQWLHVEKLSRRVVCIQVDHSAWDR
jgi:hypothetical protein